MKQEYSFGTWFRKRRRALDLTQSALADQVGYSVAMIRKIESDERRPSLKGAESLAEALEIPIDQRDGFLKVARQERTVDRLSSIDEDDAFPWQTTTQPKTNLPLPATLFLGRTEELASLGDLLQDPACRLITLMGLAGIGKSRLAVQLAHSQLDHFLHGVFFISLAPLDSPELIVTAIGNAIGIHFHEANKPQEQLLRFLQGKRMLLLLDNFEHLIQGASLLSEILQTAPDVHILVTSRERLNLQGEWVFEVEGLAYPADADEQSLKQVASYAAVRLFTQTALRVDPSFRLNKENQEWVVRICQLTEGIPLGLELAAAWVRMLSCQVIAEEIERNLAFLTASIHNIPQRHKSLRAALDHSWKLLSTREKTIFRRLSVFRGGFRREAAQSVAGADLGDLTLLMDKSLLKRVGQERYDLHELVRQYGELRLQQADDPDKVHEAHMRYYAEILRQREADLKGPRQVEALDEIEANFGNVRAAWNWAVEQRNADILSQMMETVMLFCELRARSLEGVDLFQNTLDVLAEVSGETFQSLRWWLKLCRLHLWQLQEYEFESIRMQIEEVLAVARRREDRAMIASCLYELGRAVMIAGSYQEALAIYEEALANYRILRDDFNAVRLLRGITYCYAWLGEEFLNEWQKSHQEYLNLAREVGDPSGLAHAIFDDALVIRRTQQDRTAVERLLQEANDLWQRVGDRTHAGFAKAELAYVNALDRDHDRAREMIAEAAQIAEDTNYVMLKAFVLITYGLLAIEEEDYPRSEKLFKDAIAMGDRRYTPLARIWLGISYLGQNNHEEAKQHIYQLLRLPQNRLWTQRLVSITLMGALSLAYEGQQVRAAELLGLTFTRRDDFVATPVERTPLFIRKHAELKIELGEEVYHAAFGHGKSLDLETVVQELLQVFSTGDSIEVAFSGHVIGSNEKLPEPLTERELEVLSVLAEGLSNREIAERLYISIGTVKAHTRHIYGKLDVSNRTEATAVAHKLNLT